MGAAQFRDMRACPHELLNPKETDIDPSLRKSNESTIVREIEAWEVLFPGFHPGLRLANAFGV
jgi:hypothetical protein